MRLFEGPHHVPLAWLQVFLFLILSTYLPVSVTVPKSSALLRLASFPLPLLFPAHMQKTDKRLWQQLFLQHTLLPLSQSGHSYL